ncbi:tetratricopeptide repeat protein [Streptomyces griseus]|uniref:tetratricopeptide repeat protein n=1 Tax=Streptomyces griseus TaxID=1911 RepID=UPI0034046E53
MGGELEALADVLGRGIAEGAPDLYEMLTEAVQQGVAAPLLLPQLDRAFARFHRNPIAGPLAARSLLEVLRVARRQDAVVYEEMKAIADALAEDERARDAPAPERAPDAATSSNAVSGGTFNEPVVQAGSITGGLHNYYGPPPHSGVPPVADWPQLDRADPFSFGVHRPRRISDEPPLPRYVARDCDPALDAQVRAAARDGGLVLVTGEPLSGKTRTLWAALFTNLSGTTRVLHPAPGTDLRGLTAVLRARGDAACVLWLDDLSDHLGEHGLTAALLAELARLRVPVLATMSDEAYVAHRFGSPAHARLLSGVEDVELGTEWSPAEVERLAAAAPEDLRLAGAYAHRSRHHPAAYLAVGPELLDEWRLARRANMNPHGHRVVLAAIDLARCGSEEVPADVLRRASALYREVAPAPSSENFDQALEWASGIRHGTTGMLVPGAEGGSWRAYGSLVEDARDGVPGFGPVPLELWPLALDELSSDNAGSPAVDAVLERARAVLGAEADVIPGALLTLGRIEEEYGDEAAAEAWFRRAADAGGTEAAGRLGGLLFRRQDYAAATPHLEKAAESGDVEAQCLLGIALIRRSEYWLRKAAKGGDGVAAFWLGDLLRGEGAEEDALRWYRKAAEAGLRGEVATRIGEMTHDLKDYEEAEKWFRIAVEEGDPDGLNGLGRVLEECGSLEEAARFYQQSAESGESSGAYNFGRILENRGALQEARKWFARAHELGDHDGALLVGESLLEEKRYDEAEEWFRKAKDQGHHDADRALADLKAARSGDRPGSPAPGAPDTVKA